MQEDRVEFVHECVFVHEEANVPNERKLLGHVDCTTAEKKEKKNIAAEKFEAHHIALENGYLKPCSMFRSVNLPHVRGFCTEDT